MTERTFRSPSPGRPQSAMSAAPEAPPVPKLPASMRGHQRSASTEPPQRMMSPTPRGSARGVSVDRASSTMAKSGRKYNTLPDVLEVERQNSVSSVNFSRPMSAQGHSPVSATSPGKSQGSWFAGPTGTLSDKATPKANGVNGTRTQDTSSIQNKVASAASKPTKKKQMANNAQGSHLAQANEQTAQEEIVDPVMVYDPASRTFITKPRSVEKKPEPPVPTLATPSVPKPGEYDPNTRTIVPALPPQQPSIVVTGGDNPARRGKPTLPAVNTQFQPPPRNPARTEQAPASPRAAGILQKQPSVVREDPEGEEEAEGGARTKTYTRPTNGYSKSPIRPTSIAVTPTGSRIRSESLDVPRSGSVSSGRGRNNSNSPVRSAHFSATPVMEATRHDPPERGTSPAKSAMKHSPASSIRTGSPMAVATSPHRKAMSDTSDTPSLDGVPKKKKSVRVSFTDQPEKIELPETPASRGQMPREVSPIVDDDMEEIMKPRPALPSFGSVRQNRMQQEVAEKVTERPPDRGNDSSSDHAIGGILTQNSAKSGSDPVPPEVTSRDGPNYSSDESEDEAAPATELDAGKASAKAVSEQVVGPTPAPAAEKEEEHVPEISLQPPTPGEEDKKLEPAPPRAESPPSQRSSLEMYTVPGGWKAEPSDDVPKVAPVAVDPPKTENQQDARSVADRVFNAPVSQPEPPVLAEAYDPATALNLSDIAESDSDDSAVFSDAAEDLSDLDETGFASLDAIVESPISKPKKEKQPESPSARQAEKRASKEETRAAVADWSAATSYWKQLSKQQRDQIERNHLSSDDEYRPLPNSLANRPKKKKSALKQSTSVEQVDAVMNPPAPKQAPTQPAKTTMRKSMRGPPEPAPAPAPTTGGVQLRSSLREGGGGGMRTSMRSRPQSEIVASKTSQRQNARPLSSGSSLPTAAAGGAMTMRPQSPEEISQDGPFPRLEPLKPQPQQKHQQQQPASAKLAQKMPPPPKPADDSDSESSFKKKRRPSQASADGSGKYAMRRSMRAMSIDNEQRRPTSPNPPAKDRRAWSVRSLSPTGSFFGRKQLKESMRAPPAEPAGKTLRGPNSMRNVKSKAPAKAPPPGPRARASTGGMASKFKSRFADSDDEDDRERGQKSSFFRSRFADSDDDEPNSPTVIPADLTPVRGIPRRQNQQDGDSTDLSDEDDDPRPSSRARTKQSKPMVPDSADVEKAMAAARRNLGMTNGTAAPAAAQEPAQGSALSKGSLRKPEPERPQSPASLSAPKRRGFMGSILRRSRTYSNTSQQPALNSPPPPLPTGPASPRPGKLQRRTSTATQQDRDYFSNPNPKTPAPGPGDANWPLPASGSPRPNTSDGLDRHEQAVRLARSMRPDIGGRSYSTSEGAIADANANGAHHAHVGFAEGVKEADGKGVYSAKTGKKKKFGMLRKAFGLND